MGGTDDSLVFIFCRTEVTDMAFCRKHVRTGSITRLERGFTAFDHIIRDWEILIDG